MRAFQDYLYYIILLLIYFNFYSYNFNQLSTVRTKLLKISLFFYIDQLFLLPYKSTTHLSETAIILLHFHSI